MDIIVQKCRELKNQTQYKNCLRLGVPYLEISMGILDIQDEINHELVNEQLDCGMCVNNNIGKPVKIGR